MLTNNEMKYIMTVIYSLENRGIFLKGSTDKVTSQEKKIQYFYVHNGSWIIINEDIFT